MFSPEEIRSKIEYVRTAGQYFEGFAMYKPEDLEGNIEGMRAIRKVLFITLEDLRYIVLHIISESGYKNIDNIDKAFKAMVEAQIFPMELCDVLKVVLPYKDVILRSPKINMAEFLDIVNAMPNVCEASYQLINKFLGHVAPGK